MDNNKTFCFVKKGVDRQALVVLNFTDDHQPIKVPAAFKAAKMLLSTEKYPLHREKLAPFQGMVYVAE